MLASPLEAEDAVQETLFRAWRSFDGPEGRASLRSWLYRIATNVCLDSLNGRQRRPPRWTSDLHRPRRRRASASGCEGNVIRARPGLALSRRTGTRPRWWSPGRRFALRSSPLSSTSRPGSGRCLSSPEVLRWKATEVAELLDTTVGSVNSALQRARATLAASGLRSTDPPGRWTTSNAGSSRVTCRRSRRTTSMPSRR